MKNFFKKILQIFFPSHCLACEEIISSDALFCNVCWLKLQFITEPKCKICAHPFEDAISVGSANLLCGNCLTKKPFFDKVVTIFRYNDIIKKIIGDFKYRDQTFIAKKFSKLLRDKITPELAGIDFITIVPLHKKRLRKRKFNQSALLAKTIFPQPSFFFPTQPSSSSFPQPLSFAFPRPSSLMRSIEDLINFIRRKFSRGVSSARLTRSSMLRIKDDGRGGKNGAYIKFFPDILQRNKNTITQVSLRKTQRERNLKSAFTINKKYHELVKNKNILLLDDVMTTGATLNNCAKILKKCGAKKVIILTIAKTVFKSSSSSAPFSHSLDGGTTPDQHCSTLNNKKIYSKNTSTTFKS